MKLCETCKHWDLEPDRFTDEHTKEILGRCKIVRLYYDVSQWNPHGPGRVLREESKHLKAFAQDGSDYAAALLTMPDFGCIQHEEKNDANERLS